MRKESNEMSGDDLALAFTKASGAARERAGRALLTRYDKVIEAIIRDDAARAGVHVASLEEKADLRAELRICLFEAAGSFNPEKSLAAAGEAFDHWVRYVIHNKLAELAGEDHSVSMPESWQRVARIASKVEEDLTQKLRRAPKRGELRDGVLVYCRLWAEERCKEADPEVDDIELERQVEEKLRKQGTMGAIENLDEIMSLRGSMEVIDTEYEPAGVEKERGAFDGVMAMMSETERDIIERRMGLIDGREWTFEEIGEDLGKPWPEVRRIMNLAMAKPKAPHAQYVYLSGIDSQIDSGRAGSAIGRMRARVDVR